MIEIPIWLWFLLLGISGFGIGWIIHDLTH